MNSPLRWLFAAVVTLSLQAHAQDDSSDSTDTTTTTTTETTTTTTEETPSEEASSETTNAPAPKEESWISCGGSYLQYVRGLPAAKQKGELENWWEMSDRDFRSVKRDEFAWKEQQPTKAKEFAALIAAKPETESILLKIKLGAYDFKKKGFPIDVNIDKSDKSLANHYSSSGGFSMGGIGGPPQENLGGCGMMISDIKKANQLPGTVKIRAANASQLKFIAVPEAQAKELTASLRQDRLVTAVVRYLPGKVDFVKKNMGGMALNTLYINAKIQELEFSAGDGKVVGKFE